MKIHILKLFDIGIYFFSRIERILWRFFFGSDKSEVKLGKSKWFLMYRINQKFDWKIYIHAYIYIYLKIGIEVAVENLSRFLDVVKKYLA